MDKALSEEKRRKAAGIDSRKRPPSAPIETVDAKRPKLESDMSSSTPTPNTSANLGFLASFDFTSLPAALITELVIANLESFSEPTFLSLVQAYREKHTGITPAPTPPSIPTGPRAAQLRAESGRSLTPQDSHSRPIPTGPATSTPPPPPVKVKDEPVDPLQMDIDQDELEYEPDRLNEEVGTFCMHVLWQNIDCISHLNR